MAQQRERHRNHGAGSGGRRAVAADPRRLAAQAALPGGWARDFDYHTHHADRDRLTADLVERYARALGLDPTAIEVALDGPQLALRPGAHGVAQGSTVALDSRRFDPRHDAGKRLIAHELAHVAQVEAGHQGAAIASAAAEQEAGVQSARLVAGIPAAPIAHGLSSQAVAASYGECESPAPTAREIVEPYASFLPFSDQYASLDEDGLARALAVVAQSQGPELAIQAIDFLYEADQDDVAFSLCTKVWTDDGVLAGVAPELLERVRSAMAGGADHEELMQIARIDRTGAGVCEVAPAEFGGGSAGATAAPTETGTASPATTTTSTATTAGAKASTSTDAAAAAPIELPSGEPSVELVLSWMALGERDQSKLTDRIFVLIHPEFEGKTSKSYKKGPERDSFVAAWNDAKATYVVPAQAEQAIKDEVQGNKYAAITSEELHTATQAEGNANSGTVHNAYKNSASAYGELSQTERGQRHTAAKDEQAKTGLVVDEQNADQQALIARAKAFFGAPAALSAGKQALAKLVIGASQREEDGITLNPELERRLGLFLQFCAQEDLLERTSVVGSGVRGYSTAHRLSLCYVFNRLSLGKTVSSKFKVDEFAANLVATPLDTSGYTWITEPHKAELARLVAGEADTTGKTGSDALKAFFKREEVYATAKAIGVQQDQASEGFDRGTPERLPNTGWTGVSNHCGGNALDVDIFYVFPSMYDPIIDELAKAFGVHRPVKNGTTPEYWHYECFPDAKVRS